MGFDDVFDNAEPEPSSPKMSAPSLIDSIEAFEEPWEVFCSDSDPRVGEVNSDATFLVLKLDDHAAFIGVLDGVFEEVHDHLRDLRAIRFDEHRVWRDSLKRKPFFTGARLEKIMGVAKDFANVARALPHQARFRGAKNQ